MYAGLNMFIRCDNTEGLLQEVVCHVNVGEFNIYKRNKIMK